MVFPKSDETTERWVKLLQKLKEARPQAPINGVILTLEAPELIRGFDLDERVGRVAAELRRIHDALKVRFPVYILITKCDLIPGFRTFSVNLGNENTEKQVLGWSHPPRAVMS
jgi:type VI secretion system protein ImpL